MLRWRGRSLRRREERTLRSRCYGGLFRNLVERVPMIEVNWSRWIIKPLLLARKPLWLAMTEKVMLLLTRIVCHILVEWRLKLLRAHSGEVHVYWMHALCVHLW